MTFHDTHTCTQTLARSHLRWPRTSSRNRLTSHTNQRVHFPPAKSSTVNMSRPLNNATIRRDGIGSSSTVGCPRKPSATAVPTMSATTLPTHRLCSTRSERPLRPNANKLHPSQDYNWSSLYTADRRADDAKVYTKNTTHSRHMHMWTCLHR